MFSYLLGNINGLILQANYAARITSQQEDQLEVWLLRMDRAVKTKISRKQSNFVTNYLKDYWRNNIKGITDNEFVALIPPGVRRKVYYTIT